MSDDRTERQKFNDIIQEKYKDSDTTICFIEFDLEDMFGIWQAAKHDAKPVAEIKYKRHSDGKEVWIIDDPFNSGIDEKFDLKEKAEAFAILHGYRLE